MRMLTDGTSLDNFDQAGNANWRIAERTISADRGAGFLVTKEPYDNFRIRAEFWVDEDANSGIFIRCDNPARPSAASCYEVNIYENNPNKANATGAVVGVSKLEQVPQTANHWNVMEVEAKGSQINVSVNGMRTASVSDTKHARGRIGLQYNGGVVRWHKVEIQRLTADDVAAEETPLYANCKDGFAIIFPGQPQMRDIRYTTAFGTNVPAKQYYIERNGNRYLETVADFTNGPKADETVVNQALAELGKRGEVRYRGYGDYDPGMPGGQLNIFQANGNQLRASVYMAHHNLYITEADAKPGDIDAVLFEQSITLIDHVGANIDRVNALNDIGVPFDCK
jgi:3-keto-disaccharide hydrolase